MSRRLLLLAALGTVHAETLDAQVRPSAALTANQVRVRSDLPDVTERLGGAAFGLELALRRGIVRMELEYREANLSAGAPVTMARDMSEGAVQFGIQPASLLYIAAGVHRRHFETAVGAQRWTLWELTVRAQHTLVADLAHGYVELRPVLSGVTTAAGSWGSGLGGEAGLRVQLPGLPISLRLGYQIERYRLDDGGRTETTDGIAIALAIAR